MPIGKEAMAAQPAIRAAERRPVEAEQVPAPLGPRALRIGMRTTLLAPLAAAASVGLASRGDTDLGSFAPLFVLIAIAAALATLLPWDRLFRTVWGMRILYGWAGLNILLITVASWATGGSGSSLLLLYAIMIVFFAVLFPPRAQVAFLVFALGCYTVVLASSEWEPLPLIMLGTLGFLANYLSREMKKRMAAHREARLESERRWAVVAAVSAAARDMTTTDPRRVLQGVVDAIVALGFDTARIYVRRGENDYAAVLPEGVAKDFSRGLQSLPEGIRTEALGKGRDVVINAKEAGDHTAQSLRITGFATIAATPILVGDRPEGVLVVGSARAGAITSQDVEVFAMLAAQAALALGNTRRVEEQREVAVRLSEVGRLKSDFLSNLSHELRTPLAVITGTGKTLEREWETVEGEARRDLLERLNTSSAVLDASIGGLLDFSLLEAGRLEPQMREVDIGEIVGGVIDRLAGLLRHHELRLNVQKGLTVNADPALIERVVESLLTNAAKYTPVGGWVEVTVSRDGGQRIVRVADGGRGIPADEIPHLRKPFAGGGDAETRPGGGAGIGLALASRILELQGSELEIRSEPGRGSRFWFLLPRPGEDQPVAAGEGPASADAEEPTQQLSFDDVLLSSVAAQAAQVAPPPPEEPEPPQSRSSRYGAAAVATVVTAASSLAVTGLLPEQAKQVASTVLASIGFSGPAELVTKVGGTIGGGADKPGGKGTEADADRSGDGSSESDPGDGGSTSTGTSVDSSSGGSGDGTVDGSSGGSGGGGGDGGSDTPGGSGDAPGHGDEPGKSGDAPGHKKDEPGTK